MNTASNRFGPIRDEINNIRDQVNRVIEDTFTSIGSGLPVDIYESGNNVVLVTGALIGLQTDTLDISITEGHQITIEGETAAPTDISNSQYLRRERKFGRFSKTVSISVAVVAENAKASYKNNVLTITIPKVEDESPRVVKVTPVDPDAE